MLTHIITALLWRDMHKHLRRRWVPLVLAAPLLFALLFRFFLGDLQSAPLRLAVVGGDQAALRAALDAQGSPLVDLLPAASDAAARQQVGRGAVGALIFSAGDTPPLLYTDAGQPRESAALWAQITRARQRMAGAAATLREERISGAQSSSALQRFGLSALLLLLAPLIIGAYLLPSQLAGERGDGSLRSTLLVGSYADVLLAKGVWALALMLASGGLVLLVTGAGGQPGLALLVLLLISVLMALIGLAIGTAAHTAGVASGWGTLVFLVFYVPMTLIGVLPPAGIVRALLLLLPTVQATQLVASSLADLLAGAEIAQALGVIGAWMLGAGALLAWLVRRATGQEHRS